MLTRQDFIADISERTGINVEDHPYDIGYWGRVAGFRYSQLAIRGATVREGWQEAHDELREERHANNATVQTRPKRKHRRGL